MGCVWRDSDIRKCANPPARRRARALASIEALRGIVTADRPPKRGRRRGVSTTPAPALKTASAPIGAEAAGIALLQGDEQ